MPFSKLVFVLLVWIGQILYILRETPSGLICGYFFPIHIYSSVIGWIIAIKTKTFGDTSINNSAMAAIRTVGIDTELLVPSHQNTQTPKPAALPRLSPSGCQK